MTKEEILKGNKLLAEFLGYKYYPLPEDRSYSGGWWKNDMAMTLINVSFAYLCRSHNELRFYNSMDWMLRVIDKIKETEEFCMISGNNNDWEIEISTTGYQQITNVFKLNDSLVKGCWEACVEYVEKFNNGDLKQSKK